MAELEDVTLDGKPLHSLRVADLKLALEQRNLPKSGQKNALIKRLKGALMLENLQRTSTPHIGLQPNSQIGEEMSQNSFIKQYLAKQQELLRQRLEREAREAAEADESPAIPEEMDLTGGNDGGSYLQDKHHPMPSQPPLTRAEEEGGGLPGGPLMMGQGMMGQGVMGQGMMGQGMMGQGMMGQGMMGQGMMGQGMMGQGMMGQGMMGQGMMGRRPDFSSGSVPQESSDTPGGRIQRPPLHPGHEEPATPSPPRAVASLSVRVLGQPERQGLPPSMPRPQEKEGIAPSEPGSAHPVLHQSRSARAAAGRAHDESDDDDDDDDDDSEEDEEWGPAAGARRGGGGRAPPMPPQPSPSVPTAGRERSRRKLQPPQHIPPQQVHQPPMLRQPTPPPSPPPELSFPLPDTPKQSPPDMDEPEGAGPGMAGGAARPPPGLQRQDSDSSSRSSSPEPPQQRRPGPLSLLARKMESEGAFGAEGRKRGEDGQAGPVMAGSGESLPGVGDGPSVVVFPGSALAHTGSSAGHVVPVPELLAPVDMSATRPTAVPTITLGSASELQRQAEREKGQTEERKEKESSLPPWKRGRDFTSATLSAAAASQVGAEEPPGDQGGSATSPQTSRKSFFQRDTPQAPTSPPGTTRRPRMFSDTSTGSMVSPAKLEHPLRQGVLVSGPQSADMEVTATPPDKASPKKPDGNDVEMPNMELKKRGPLEFKDVPVKSQLEPMGPVLPPVAPAGKVAERGRQEKKDRGKKSPVSSDSSSSDSDSGSSSSGSSSSSSQDKSRPTRLKKKAAPGKGDGKGGQVKGQSKKLPAREVKSQPSGPSVMEVDQDSESSPAQAVQEADPDRSEGRLEESSTPKAFAARKISLTTGSKTSPVGGEAGAGEAESGGLGGRKRRWGSSTAVTTKKPSISITTDSLKSLIPDIKASQEAVVELHPEELHLSGEEEEEERGEEDTPSRENREDQGLDKGLQIRRTVTQVVPGEGQKNGQRDQRDEEEEEKRDQERGRTRKDRRKSSASEDALKTEPSTKDTDAQKVTPSDTLVRRSISQQKSGVSITIDDPVRLAKQPSPPRGKVSKIVHVSNLVRPFTLGQLKELLNRSGSLVEEGFWIDKIKSHCYVTYATTEEAVATRAALHGVKWPQSNPKVLSVDFCEQEELDFHRGLLVVERAGEEPHPGGPHGRPAALPPLMPERGGLGGVRDQWAEREREMERRERTRAEREWDRDKIRDFGRPGEEGRRSPSRERRRKERGKSKEKKTDKKAEKGDEPPVKLLDDLFQKTKAAPCIYWLPLSEEQAAQRVLDRAERQKERERRRKELQEEEEKKREEERKERVKNREKEGGAAAAAGGAGGAGGAGRGVEGDKDRERERDKGRERGRDREGGDKRREGYRPRAPSGGVVAGRRSRSRSNPRDRRR
ncbi:apoptotic chromatin condensation inducer 1b isoform X3 [Osmerus eperlanus]|uniref:apoptotic chromatin condensation inducer 1b isoform X3 n=1 Tax=Osmerus eperlanus TaxID=29151 RepID=UPI002E0DCE2B